MIDYDFNGAIAVVIQNFSKEHFNIKIGDRIAELIIERICNCEFTLVDELKETARDSKGFGGTDVTFVLPAAKEKHPEYTLIELVVPKRVACVTVDLRAPMYM